MALSLASKAPTDVVRYSWTPPVIGGDTVSSATLTVSSGGIVIDSYGVEEDSVFFFASGGAVGGTAVIAASAVTNDGETLTETIYLPIIASTTQIAHTAREYATFALRRVIGNGETPSADEMTDAIERLNAMVAEWRVRGADIGAAFPIVADTVIYCPDYAVSALRYNLLMDVASLYGEQVTQQEAVMARNGLALIQHRNLPDIRTVEYF